MGWVYLIGDGLLRADRPRVRAARRAAGVDRRREPRASRRSSTPPGAAGRLRRPAGRPLPHRERARAVAGPDRDLVDEAIEAGGPRPRGDAAVAAVLPRLRAARGRSRASALDGVRARTCATTSCPRRDGRGPPGPRAVRARRWPTRCGTRPMTPERIRERAEREFDAVRAEMIRIAREIAPAWLRRRGRARRRRRGRPGRPRRDRRRAPRAPTSSSTSAAPSWAGSRRSAASATSIGLADEPLEIRWTPVFLRAFGGAMLELAGSARPRPEGVLLDHADPRGLDRRSRPSRTLREDNDRMLRLLTIHEAVPGHYLQGVYAQPLPVDRPGDLRERRLRRGLGGLRDPGDDGRGLRRGRPGAPADAIGSTTCGASRTR